MMTPTALDSTSKASSAKAAATQPPTIMQRMQAEDKHEQAVNEVMEEIEDQLDSD